MRPLPAFPLDVEPNDSHEDLARAVEYSSDMLEDDPDDRDPSPVTRPAMRSGVGLTASLDDLSFGERSELEWRLYHRGRFAAEHHKLNVLTLRRLDAMYDRLAGVRTLDDAQNVVRAAFLGEEERRAALVPLLGVLYPLAYFDEQMPTPDVVRLIAHAEVRRPANPVA